MKPSKPVYVVDDTLPVLDAWTHHANGDHAAAMASLSTLLGTNQSQHSVFMELQWLTDLACFAERDGDIAASKKWTDKLHERADEMRAKSPHLSLGWMRKASAAPYSWARVRFDQELAWLSSHEPALLNVAP